jgi:hypothetical protein
MTVKAFSITKAVKEYKALDAQIAELKSQELIDLEKRFEQVKKSIGDYGKAQGAFVLKNVSCELQPFEYWSAPKLEEMAIRNPDILGAKVSSNKAIIKILPK